MEQRIHNIVAAQETVDVIFGHHAVPVGIVGGQFGKFRQLVDGPFAFQHHGIQIRQTVGSGIFLVEGQTYRCILIVYIDGGRHSKQLAHDSQRFHRTGIPPGLFQINMGYFQQVDEISLGIHGRRFVQTGVHHIVGVIACGYRFAHSGVNLRNLHFFQSYFYIIAGFHGSIPVIHGVVDGFPGEFGGKYIPAGTDSGFPVFQHPVQEQDLVSAVIRSVRNVGLQTGFFGFRLGFRQVLTGSGSFRIGRGSWFIRTSRQGQCQQHSQQKG